MRKLRKDEIPVIVGPSAGFFVAYIAKYMGADVLVYMGISAIVCFIVIDMFRYFWDLK